MTVHVFMLGLNDGDDVLAIYVGDNQTDEDAFKVIHIMILFL